VHHNIAAYKKAVLRHVTVLIPWHGQNEDLLRETIRSLPSGIRLVVAKNAGKHEMAAALNAALETVKTRFVFCMGSDDVLDDRTLWRLWEAALGADGSYPWMLGFGAERFRFKAEPWSVERLQDRNVCGVFLVKTSAIRKVGGWRDVAVEDWDLTYRLAKAGYRLNPAPLARYGYRQRHDGLHRTTVREAQKLKLRWRDLAPVSDEERKHIPGVFFEWKLDGTGYVRCELPARCVGGVARVSFDEHDAHESPAWVFQYPNEDARVVWDLARKMGKKRVIDVDDNYLSPDLERVVSEYHAENGREWGRLQESHRRMVEEADAIICATNALAEVYGSQNPNVFVCENSIDPADWEVTRSKKKIVGTVLSANHKKHFPLVEEALRAASLESNVEVQVLGLDPDWDFAYTHIGFTPGVPAYRRVLSRWSVGLAPIIENDVTRCKSDLKWLEFTKSGAVLVGSSVEPYSRIPEGCIERCDSPSSFTIATLDLLRDESRRRGMLRVSNDHIDKYRLVSNDDLRSRYNLALG
jgi:hypothetical protein